jgi:hypothetical protein
LTDEEFNTFISLDGYGWNGSSRDIFELQITTHNIVVICYDKSELIPVSNNGIDFIRSIGILLPFTYLDENKQPITLSTDELITKGWVKIKPQSL